jgi:Sec-independent protein translocase protein TatA
VRVPETLLILFVVLLIVGARHVTNPGRVLGRGVRDFEPREFGRNKRDGELPGENLDEKL